MLKKAESIAPWLLLILLAGMNFLLLRQNWQMRGALAKTRPAETAKLPEGALLPAFAGTNLTGELAHISYGTGEPRRMFLYFTPTCPYCREQFVYWKEILQQAQAKGIEVVGLVDAREDQARLENYLEQMGCGAKSPFPLRAVMVQTEVKQKYKLQSTPITILIKSDGALEKQWVGRWTSDEAHNAAASLGLNLSSH